MKQIFFLLILSAIFFPNILSAQQKNTFTLKGSVVDTISNSPAQFSTLSIATKAEPNKQLKVLATDDKGNFQIGLNSAGEYILSVSYLGSKVTEIPFTIEAKQGDTDLGTISVSEASLLDEAVVVAQKPLVTVDLDKLIYDTQSDPDSRTETALEMLRKVPMVTVDAEEKIQLRGSSSFKVYVNGRPSTMMTNNPSEVLRSMPAANIKNIEVITDPGAKYDAEGVGGIINIIMARSNDDGYTASIEGYSSIRGAYGGSAFLTLKYGKFGFSGGYNYGYWTRPADEIHSERIYFANNSVLTQTGLSKNKMPNQWGSGELSYEIDTLNLITISLNRHYGKGKFTNDLNVQQTQNDIATYSYLYYLKTTREWGSTEVNANYQRAFKKKGMLLTGSYRYSFSPNDSENETSISQAIAYLEMKEQSLNEASTSEHTFQIDYVNPIKSKHNIELGAKYIIRLNDSDVHFEEYNFTTNTWERNPDRENDMDYRQDIISGYGSYSYKLNKWGAKFGVRVEHTNTDANFKFRQQDGSYSRENINNGTTDIVPSAALSYQLAPTKTLRLNYNMRISRPGIWYLNPFVNDSNPDNISFGNPNLESERTNNLSLSYGSFSQKFNLNLSLRYSLTDNSIEQYASVKNGITENTYDNIGEKQNTALDLFASWTPIKDLRFMVNASAGYIDIKSNNQYNDSNHGIGGSFFANASYSFLKSFRASIFSGFFKSPVGLQTSMSAFSFMGFNIGKDFFDKKLSLTVAFQDPFGTSKSMTIKSRAKDFSYDHKMTFNQQNINFRLSYKFGNLKNQQIKKAQRGITNDDVLQGSGANTTGAPNP